MKTRNDGSIQRRRMLGSACVMLGLVLFFCFYYSSFITSRLSSTANNPNTPKGSSSMEGIKAARSFRARIKPNQDEEEEGRQNDSFLDQEDEISVKQFPVCDASHTELIPCLDRQLHYNLKMHFNLRQMEHYERHCPPPDRRLNCLIPPPENYTVPIRWPESRDKVWRANVPHTFLAFQKSDQHWMVVEGDIIRFPGGGTHFHNGAPKYIESLARMLRHLNEDMSNGGKLWNFLDIGFRMLGHPNEDMSNGGKLRTFLDIGCGVASFGAYLLDHGILTMSVAPNDVHANQIQFALERGITSILGVLGTKRLTFPSKSFDLAHCSRCRIDWLQNDGILLFEVDRLLRPGGYFAWSSPPAYREDAEDVRIWNRMSDLVNRMCWTVAAKEGQTVIWVKPLNNDCYNQRNPATHPPMCIKDEDPDFAWDTPMKPCLTPLSEQNDRDNGAGLVPWPKRLVTPPPRLQDLPTSEDTFKADTEVWGSRVEAYWVYLNQVVSTDSVRNVMDMKAHLGGFAAALTDKPVWVMNVVPTSGPNTLKVIYDRGLVGTMHDWCESFSTYPRTYDLLHAWNILSEIDNQVCSIEDLLLEMDRILRPMGLLIIRDKAPMIEKVQKYLDTLHWNAWKEVVNAEADDISTADEKILFAQKDLWVPDDIL